MSKAPKMPKRKAPSAEGIVLSVEKTEQTPSTEGYVSLAEMQAALLVLPTQFGGVKGCNQYVNGSFRYDPSTEGAANKGQYHSGEGGVACGPDSYVSLETHRDNSPTNGRGITRNLGVRSRRDAHAAQVAVDLGGEMVAFTPKALWKKAAPRS